MQEKEATVPACECTSREAASSVTYFHRTDVMLKSLLHMCMNVRVMHAIVRFLVASLSSFGAEEPSKNLVLLSRGLNKCVFLPVLGESISGSVPLRRLFGNLAHVMVGRLVFQRFGCKLKSCSMTHHWIKSEAIFVKSAELDIIHCAS